jgi:hypothetical protein
MNILALVVSELRAEHALLGHAIAKLEELATHPQKRRGRKGMPEGERVQVSNRMKQYWSGKRKPEAGS